MTKELALRRLKDLEEVIANGKKTFEQVGRAIAEIRDRKLYVEEYGTFDEYMRKRWGWSARRGYQLIEASSIDAKSSSRFDLTANAAEHLAKVPAPKRPALLKAAAENGPVTAESISFIFLMLLLVDCKSP